MKINAYASAYAQYYVRQRLATRCQLNSALGNVSIPRRRPGDQAGAVEQVALPEAETVT